MTEGNNRNQRHNRWMEKAHGQKFLVTCVQRILCDSTEGRSYSLLNDGKEPREQYAIERSLPARFGLPNGLILWGLGMLSYIFFNLFCVAIPIFMHPELRHSYWFASCNSLEISVWIGLVSYINERIFCYSIDCTGRVYVEIAEMLEIAISHMNSFFLPLSNEMASNLKG